MDDIERIKSLMDMLEMNLSIMEKYPNKKDKDQTYKLDYQAMRIIKEALEKQLNDGWIPCIDRDPEFDQDCLVTTDSGEIFTSKFYGYGEECQGYKEYPEGVWEINQCELEVIAWQPLPEKYKS